MESQRRIYLISAWNFFNTKIHKGVYKFKARTPLSYVCAKEVKRSGLDKPGKPVATVVVSIKVHNNTFSHQMGRPISNQMPFPFALSCKSPFNNYIWLIFVKRLILYIFYGKLYVCLPWKESWSRIWPP